MFRLSWQTIRKPCSHDGKHACSKIAAKVVVIAHIEIMHKCKYLEQKKNEC